MDKRSPSILTSLFRGVHLVLHLCYAVLLAIFYPHLNQTKRRRILKNWSRDLLNILNIGIRTEGEWPVRGESGYLVVANHVSWLDIFALNAIYPARFIAQAEVRNWPLIGWLCERANTLFIERAMHQDAASINQRVSFLLKQGVCVGLFPEGPTTDGKQVGHFHSALIQPAIDAGAMLCLIALRYQHESGKQSVATYTGDLTLFQSTWRILRSPHFDVLMVFTPALTTVDNNRRVLARAAQEGISQKLHNMAAPAEYRVFPLNPLPLHALNRHLNAPIPPLIKCYLRMDAYICGEPSWNAEFNTADLLILLPMACLYSR